MLVQVKTGSKVLSVTPAPLLSISVYVLPSSFPPLVSVLLPVEALGPDRVQCVLALTESVFCANGVLEDLLCARGRDVKQPPGSVWVELLLVSTQSPHVHHPEHFILQRDEHESRIRDRTRSRSYLEPSHRSKWSVQS